MQKHTVYAKTYSICNNIQYMQIIEYMQKHKQYAKTYSICQKYKICKNIQNMQNLLFYRICNNMQKYAKPALFRRSQVLVTLCSCCGPTGYVQIEERWSGVRDKRDRGIFKICYICKICICLQHMY